MAGTVGGDEKKRDHGEDIADKLGIRRVADLEFVEKEDAGILVLKPIPKMVFRKMVAKHVSGGVSGRGMFC